MGYVGFEPTTNRLKAEYSTAELITLAEVVGFEPTDAHKDIGGLANRCIKPLCHTSIGAP
jgi:hypothetical protein